MAQTCARISGIYIGELIAGIGIRLTPVAFHTQPQKDGAGHEYRRIRPDDHAPDHGKDKTTDHVTPQHVKCQKPPVGS